MRVLGNKTAIASEASGSTLVFEYKKVIPAWMPVKRECSHYCPRASCAGTRFEHSHVLFGFILGAQERHPSTVLFHNIRLRPRLEISMIRTPFQSFRPQMLSVTHYVEVHFIEYSLVRLLLEGNIILNLIFPVIMSRRRQDISSKKGKFKSEH